MTVSMLGSLQTSTVQQLLHRLGRRISELPGSGDLDLLAACGIATLTFGRFLDFELSKSWKRNLIAVRSRAHDAVEHAVHNCLSLRLAHAIRLCNFRNEFGRVHSGLLQNRRAGYIA